MRYFKRYWDEDRGNEHAAWGCSWWYFESDESGVVLRHIEVYDNGPTLHYSTLKPTDEFGFLADQPLEFNDFARFETTKDEFELAWGSEPH